MTGPRGGETTVTAGGLRRTAVTFDASTLVILDAEVERLRQRGDAAPSRSSVLRRLVRQHLAKPVT